MTALLALVYHVRAFHADAAFLMLAQLQIFLVLSSSILYGQAHLQAVCTAYVLGYWASYAVSVAAPYFCIVPSIYNDLV
jgi:hypothetical protein